MLQGFRQRARTFGGEVRWCAQASEICVEREGDDEFRSRALGPDDEPLVTARVLQPGSVRFIRHEANELERCLREKPGHTFTGVSQHDGLAIAACIETRRLRKVPPGVEVIPVEVALAYLSLWAHTDEEYVGVYWTDGVQVLRVVTRHSTLSGFEGVEIDRMASEMSWVDHSDPDVVRRPPKNLIEGSCGFTGGAALAVGAATAAAKECGGFVNPKVQTVTRNGVMTTTMPLRQITV